MQSGIRRTGKAKDTEKNIAGLAVALKKQMNDIIDVAFKNYPYEKRKAYKHFYVYCLESTRQTFLADCRYYKGTDKPSEIRIFALKDEAPKAILVTAMHELSHHIDHVNRDKSGHDKEFYEIHKKLLFAAMDMGIIKKTDVTESETMAQNAKKLARMMSEYVPHPVSYQDGKRSIHVYGAFDQREMLKERGYKWNALDKAWVLNTTEDSEQEELSILKEAGIDEKNIKTSSEAGVIVRLQRYARLFGVPYEKREVVKKLGFRWKVEGDEKYWERTIDGNELPKDIRDELRKEFGTKVTVKIK